MRVELRTSACLRYNEGQRRASVLGCANKAALQNYGAPLAQILRCREQFVNGFAEQHLLFLFGPEGMVNL